MGGVAANSGIRDIYAIRRLQTLYALAGRRIAESVEARSNAVVVALTFSA